MKSAVAEKPAADDDPDADPFDVDTSAVAQAPPMAPRPAKGRMIRIVCPMCETPGFIAPRMQGRDVKCCNAECLVPVFKSPRPERKVEQADDSGGGVSTKTLLLGATVGLPAVLFLAWFFVLRDSGPKDYVPPSDTGLQTAGPTAEKAADGDGETQDVEPVHAKISLAEIQREALKRGIDAALEQEGNRSKPYCRRMMAEAYAIAGQIKGARRQLERLRKVTPEPFYRVEPLVEIAWQQLADGDRAAAERTVDEAFNAAENFPAHDRSAVAAVSSVGAVLGVFGRIDDAQAAVRRLDRQDDAALSRERVATLSQIAFDLEMFDLDKVLHYSSLDLSAEPVAIAITVGIAAQGDWEHAIDWALANKDVVAQEDCLAAAAVVAGRESALTGDSAPVSAVTRAAQGFPVAGQSRVAAGVATGSLIGGDREAATAALQQALTLLDDVPRPAAVPVASVKRIHDAADRRNYGLPKSSPLRSAAIGAAQMAHIQMHLGDEEAAWATFLRAWEFTQGMGPQYRATMRLADEITKSQSRAKQRLSRDLNIKKRDLLDRAFRKYRRAGGVWGGAANTRFQLEVGLLKKAVLWGMRDEVAALLADPVAVIPSAVGQPYRSTSLVSTLAEAYAAFGDDAKSREVAALAAGRNIKSDPIAPLIAETERLFLAEKYVDAAQALRDFRGSEGSEQLRDLRAMQLACRLVNLGRPDRFFPYLRALDDSILIEDCLECAAALAVQQGMAVELWERHENERLNATQRVAFYRGLVAGIAARK